MKTVHIVWKKNGKCDFKKIIYKVYIEKVNGLDLTKEIIEYLGCKVDIENIKDSRYIYIVSCR